jgi:hypothetical protein
MRRGARLLAAHPTLPHYPQPDGRVKLAAGWLIEQAGWKGRDLGPVGMYEKQALVLVNRGGATGADVTALMRAVQLPAPLKHLPRLRNWLGEVQPGEVASRLAGHRQAQSPLTIRWLYPVRKTDGWLASPTTKTQSIE